MPKEHVAANCAATFAVVNHPRMLTQWGQPEGNRLTCMGNEIHCGLKPVAGLAVEKSELISAPCRRQKFRSDFSVILGSYSFKIPRAISFSAISAVTLNDFATSAHTRFARESEPDVAIKSVEFLTVEPFAAGMVISRSDPGAMYDAA
jgi:hypothetical protein